MVMDLVAIGGNLREIWALWADLQLVKSLQLSSNQELSQLTPATALRSLFPVFDLTAQLHLQRRLDGSVCTL